MFAYCLNNPVNCYDSSGTSAVSYCNGDRNPLFIGYYGCGGGGGGGSYSGYSGGGNSHHEDIFEELDAITDETLDAVGSFAEACWDAYMHEYNRQQNAQTQNAILLNEGIKSLTTTYDSIKDGAIVKMGKLASKSYKGANLIRHGLTLYFAPIPTVGDEFLGTGYIIAGILYSAFGFWEANK